MTSKFILECLLNRFAEDGYLAISELRSNTGYGDNRTIDLFVMALWLNRGIGTQPRNYARSMWRGAFEIKVSRSDFKNEITDPTKRAPFEEISNEFYFVTPKDLLDPKEIPVKCGLIEISEDSSRLKYTKKARWHEQEPNWDFVSSLLRDVSRGKCTIIAEPQHRLSPTPEKTSSKN